jgi:hypothetical protein
MGLRRGRQQCLVVRWNLGTGRRRQCLQQFSAGQQWVVPVGAGVGRVIKLFDKLPINLQLGAYYNAVHPSQTGPSWQLRSQLTFIF